MFKKLLCTILAIFMCVSLSITAFATDDIDIVVDETICENGDRVWRVTENGKTSIVNIYHDRDYILVDGKQFLLSNEIVGLQYQKEEVASKQTFAAPKWVYIYSESISAETQKTFNEYTAAVLGGIIGSYFGMPGSVAVSIAATAIARAANENVLDLERDVYGNQYALNHYKYEDFTYASGIFIKKAIWYNPSIY